MRGRWGLSHHFCTTSDAPVTSVAPVAPVANSKNVDLAVIYGDLAFARSPSQAWLGPRGPWARAHGPGPGAAARDRAAWARAAAPGPWAQGPMGPSGS